VEQAFGPIEWFGTDPAATATSPDRGASIALWRLDSDAPAGFKAEPFVDTHMVCVHLNGSMLWSATCNDRSYRAPCDPNTLCIARAGEGADVEYSHAHLSFAQFFLPVRWFESDMVDAASARCGSTIELIDPMNRTCFTVASLARQAVGAMRAGGPAARLKIDAALIELAAALVKHHSTAVSARPAKGGLAPAVLRRVVDYLVAHLADEVTLAELASLAGVSAPHFCRAFAASTGLSPHRYQIALRIEEATRLLEYAALSIADVGSAVGYDDPSYFSRLFASQTGLSPRAWRAAALG
jgi:AraC-like DNA-binding protein